MHAVLLALAALAADAPETEGTLTVTATRDARPRKESPGNVTVIGDDELRFEAPVHPGEALDRAPGTWVTRGSNQEHLTAIRSPVLTGPGACGAFLFLEDSLPVRAAGFCNVNGLFELNTEQARAIEVVRGPGSALYGSNALHGLVNVLMPRPGDTSGTAWALDAGEDGYTRIMATLPGDGRWRLDAHATHDDGWRDASGFDLFKANFGYEADHVRWSFAATGLRQDTAGFILGEDAYRDDDAARSNPTPGAFRHAQSQRASVEWRLASGGVVHTLTPYARHNDMRFLQHFIPGTPVEENGHVSVGIQWLVRGSGRDTWTVGSDVEFTHGFVEQVQAEDLTDASAFLNATRPRGTHYDFTVDAVTAGVFGEARYAFADVWRVVAGARLERTRYDYDNRTADGNLREDGTPCAMGGCIYNRPADRTDTFDAFAPKLALSRSFDEDTDAYLAIATGFRAPQVNELYRLQRGQDAADLGTERLDSIELGLRRATGGPAFDTAVFAMHKRNVVFQDSAGFAVSDGRTRHYGVEFTLRTDLTDRYYLGASGTLARHEYDFDRAVGAGDVIARGNEVDTAPRRLGAVRLGWRHRTGSRIEIEVVHIGAHWLDAANAHRYGGHTILHLRGSHAIGGGWRIGWRITNLTDRAYAERADFAFGEYRYFPGPPRTVFISVSRGPD